MTTTPHDDGTAAIGALDDAIHTLAQPLTAMLFQLELGALRTDSHALRDTLDEARVECLRAIQALEAVRSAAHALRNNGEPS